MGAILQGEVLSEWMLMKQAIWRLAFKRVAALLDAMKSDTISR
jgi:hypothetical protein